MDKIILNQLSEAKKMINENIKPHLGNVLLFSIKSIINNSNFDSSNKYLTDVFNPNLMFKNNIFSGLNRSLNSVKLNETPIVALLINKKHYLFINNIKDTDIDINVSDYDKIYLRDLFIMMLELDNDNEDYKLLRYHFLYFYILFLLNYKGSNIFLFVNKNVHGDYFIQMLDFIYDKILNKVKSGQFVDVGNSFYTYYSNYLYGEIIEFKYKYYNNNIDNIELFKFLHVLYKKDSNIPESVFKMLILEKIDQKYGANIHNKFKSDYYLDLMYKMYSSPYGQADFSLNSRDSIDYELVIEDDYSLSNSEYLNNIETMINAFGVGLGNTYFYTLYYLLFLKVGNNKDKILLFKKYNPYVESFFASKISKDDYNRYLITIYNLLVFNRNKN